MSDLNINKLTELTQQWHAEARDQEIRRFIDAAKLRSYYEEYYEDSGYDCSASPRPTAKLVGDVCTSDADVLQAWTGQTIPTYQSGAGLMAETYEFRLEDDLAGTWLGYVTAHGIAEDASDALMDYYHNEDVATSVRDTIAKLKAEEKALRSQLERAQQESSAEHAALTWELLRALELAGEALPTVLQCWRASQSSNPRQVQDHEPI